MRIALICALALAWAGPSAATDHMIEVADQVGIAVQDEGPRTGKPIVFVPGWGMSRSVWRKQVEALSSSYRVLVIEPRSQGASTTVDGDVSAETKAQDLARVLEYLDLTDVTLVAWSQAVQDASALIRTKARARLRGAVLVDAMPSAGPAEASDDPGLAFALRMSNVILRSPDAYAEGMVDAIFAKPLSETERDGFVRDVLRTPPAVGVASMIASLFGSERRTAWKSAYVPVLVVASSSNPQRKALEHFAEGVPGATYAEVAESGHALFYDQPQQFNALLASFADQLAVNSGDCGAECSLASGMTDARISLDHTSQAADSPGATVLLDRRDWTVIQSHDDRIKHFAPIQERYPGDLRGHGDRGSRSGSTGHRSMAPCIDRADATIRPVVKQEPTGDRTARFAATPQKP